MSDDNAAPPTDVKIPKRLRYEILRRDGHTCRYCGASAPNVRLTVDHVLPRVLGGNNDPTNLVTACVDCNSGKTSIHPDSPLVADVEATAIRYAAAMARAREIDRQALADESDLIYGWHIQTVEWLRVCWPNQVHHIPDDYFGTLTGFVHNGLNAADLAHATAVAGGKQDFYRYFCGVCRTIIRRRHELAETIIERGD